MLRKLSVKKLAFVSNNSHYKPLSINNKPSTDNYQWHITLSWICNDEYIYIESSS